MLSYVYGMVRAFINEHKYPLISLSSSIIFLMTTIQRHDRLKNEYDHYERRHRTLQSIACQKRDELEKLVNHINQLLLLEEKRTDPRRKENPCVYDHGDHPSMPSMFSLEKYVMDDDNEEQQEEEESDDDPLLQRLKLIKPTRLKLSSRQLSNNRNTTILDEIHTVYGKYLSE